MKKTLRKSERESSKLNVIKIEKLKEYYTQLLTENRMNFLKENININISSDDYMEKIIIPELRKALKDYKNKKAAEPRNIPKELIKNGP